MLKLKTVVILLLNILLCSKLVANNPILLNDDEKKWLKEHPVITLAPDPDFPPFELFDEKGNYKGLASDFVNEVEKILNIKIKIVKLKNWNEVLTKIKNKEIDMLGAAVPTPERLKYLKFTKTFVKVPAVVIVRKDSKITSNFEALSGLRVVVVKNYAVEEYVRAKFPKVKLETAPDIVAGLRLVSFGRVDAMIVNEASALYYIQKEGISNLEILINSGFIYDLSMATRFDYGIFVSILDKALQSIPKRKVDEIISPYFSLNRKGMHLSVKTLVFISIFFLVLIILSVYVHIYRLNVTVKEKTQALEEELEKNKKLLKEVHNSKKMESIGLIAGSVAHDLNNILSGVVTYPDLLLHKMEKDSPYRRQLKIIKNSAEKAAAIVEDMLTMARSVASERKPINVKKMIRNYLNSPEFKEIKNRFPNVNVSSSFENDVMNIVGSEVHIEKLINNLVLNGMEAVKKDNVDGLVKIAVKNVFIEKPFEGFEYCNSGNFVEISIKDNGTGLSDEVRKKIFEPFFSTKSMGKSGTGLGLAIVWNTVLTHKGMLKVASDGKSFTEFILYFPGTNLDEEKHSKLKSLDTILGNREKILVVDDEFVQIEILKDTLESLNYKVFTAMSGEEGVRVLKKYGADLVILDMLMPPGINGRVTYEKMLKINPTQKAIISTGMASNEEVEKTLELGASAMLSKPYSVEKIGEAVKKALMTKK